MLETPSSICEYPRIYLIFLETRIIDLHFPLILWVYLHSIFLVGSVRLFYFCKSDVSAVQGHPRTLILVPIESAYSTSYMSVNLGPIFTVSWILLVFCSHKYDPTPFSTVFGVFPLDQIADVGVNLSRYLPPLIFWKYSNL